MIKRNAYRLSVRKPERMRPPQDIGGWIILGWIVERWDGAVWTGLVWLKIGTSRELL
jgi:hypothetical protein